VSGGCSCDPKSCITRLTVAGVQVSLSGVTELFAEWRAWQRQAAELSNEEILAGLRKHNYVSTNVEAEYAQAIRSLYAHS
jgi:hypothetical protein